MCVCVNRKSCTKIYLLRVHVNILSSLQENTDEKCKINMN